jgi:hypothetical protein
MAENHHPQLEKKKVRKISATKNNRTCHLVADSFYLNIELNIKQKSSSLFSFH